MTTNEEFKYAVAVCALVFAVTVLAGLLILGFL